jgi:hypothetical protein
MKDTFPYISKYAFFSDDHTQRFILHRRWNLKPCAMVIGLNPSTADEHEDDPTIGFITRILNYNGFGGLYMVNLFTMITSHPKELIRDVNESRAVDTWVASMAFCKDVVFAWGNFKTLGRNETAKRMFKNPLCFAILKSGEPRHAMYLKENTLLKKFYGKVL